MPYDQIHYDPNTDITTYWDEISGDKMYYVNNDLHRENGAAIEYGNGDKSWYINGKQHRVGGPAIDWNNNCKCWCIHGKYHREDGPAVEHANGHKEWWLNGKHINCSSQEEFERLLKLKAFW